MFKQYRNFIDGRFQDSQKRFAGINPATGVRFADVHEATQAMVFSADETTDVGCDFGTAVSSDYTAASSRFTGKIAWVQIDLGLDDHDHFIDPDERLRVAMARQ